MIGFKQYLSELSKDTLKSYVKKSIVDKESHDKIRHSLQSFAKKHNIRNVKTTMTGGKNGIKYKDVDRKSNNRSSGINKAVNKL